MIQERLAAIAAITAPLVLECVADAYAGPAIVLKGPDLAALYPAPGMRNYWDIDLLVEDAEGAQRALLEAGFEPVGDQRLCVDIHHLRPLRSPAMPLAVEIHSRPKRLEDSRPPMVAELFDVAPPSITGVDGMFTLPAAHHAVLLAVHSWAHEPLRRLRDIVEIAAMAARADPLETERVARRWEVERLWRTTAAVVDALFARASSPLVLKT